MWFKSHVRCSRCCFHISLKGENLKSSHEHAGCFRRWQAIAQHVKCLIYIQITNFICRVLESDNTGHFSALRFPLSLTLKVRHTGWRAFHYSTVMQSEALEQETECSLVELHKKSSHSKKNLPFTSRESLQLTSLNIEIIPPLFEAVVSQRQKIFHWKKIVFFFLLWVLIRALCSKVQRHFRAH